MLKIANNLSLPIEAVTQSFAILAKRRAGKSYTARRFMEQLMLAKQQVVAVDPKGDWWGVRYGADGKSPGLPVIVLGGEHGDLPLEVHSGEVIAKLAVEERVSVLLDLSSFRKNEVATFMTGFLENFYRMKAQEKYRTPVMLIVDEADAIAPQRPFKGEERMLGAIEDIVRRGGQRGIGTLAVTQRSAVLNKNVLTQTQVLVAMRTIAPQDLEAMNAWIDVHGTTAQRKILMESLPSLPTGTAWFWSPGWPGEQGIFKNVQVLPIETFDSGATPKPGEKRVEPKNAADIDLDALRRQMAATIEKAKAEDPRELQRRLRDAHAKIAQLEKAKAAPVHAQALEKADSERLKKEFERGANSVKVALAKELRQYENVANARARIADLALSAVHTATEKAIEDRINTKVPAMPSLDDIIEQVKAEPVALQNRPETPRSFTPKPRQAGLTRQPPPQAGLTRQPKASSNGSAPEAGLRRMLIALAQRNGLSSRQVGVRAGMSSKSGTFGTYLSKARTCGWISGDKRNLEITSEGVSALGDFDPLPTGRALLDFWRESWRRARPGCFSLWPRLIQKVLARKSWVRLP